MAGTSNGQGQAQLPPGNAYGTPLTRFFCDYDHTSQAVLIQRLMQEANTPYVLCLEAGVLIRPGAIQQLLRHCQTESTSLDLWQGPILTETLAVESTHLEPQWSQGRFGVSGCDERGQDIAGEPFAIAMQDLGLFACHREAWPGLNPRFLGDGGLIGYLQEKYRRQGGVVKCLPFLGWSRLRVCPSPHPNPLGWLPWEETIRNHAIAFHELGWSLEPMFEHGAHYFGHRAFATVKQQISTELENPFFYFDAIYCINLDRQPERWEIMEQRFYKLGILHRVHRFSAIETPESHHIGCTLSHRTIVERAQQLGLDNVLVFEDDALFLDTILEDVSRCVEELKRIDWQIFQMGGHRWGNQFPLAPNCQALEHPCCAMTSAHALAYHVSVFDKILRDIPPDIAGVAVWNQTNYAIDQYIRAFAGRYATRPVLSSQPILLSQEDPALRDRFTL
ncbi:glycosyltransferase family 25 protein [Spirulina major]|uniref:glycosyltransferase family 25 protein n=1 Tax=Spirulina major TaxID=270636 RepID=UPI001587A15F|nr:glycosyltransferase family 25 protein [Spirulina major]